MQNDNAVLVLNKLMSRARLGDAEQAAILGLSWKLSKAEAHGDIVERGAEVNTCCIVIDGLVARTGHTVDGERQITAFYIPGDMPDLHVLMLPHAPATLHAIIESRILRVPRADLRGIFMRFPTIAEALWRETVADANIAFEWIVNVGRRPARQRLAHLLCEMAQRSVEAPEGSFDFLFPVTQIHLAEATGVSNVHVNRIVQELRRAGLLDLKDHRVFIHDWDALKAEAGFFGAYLDPMRVSRSAYGESAAMDVR